MAEEESEIKVSKYNSGIAIIMRLDALWKDTHRHSRAGMFYKWNQDLDRIWVELARDLNNAEFEDKVQEIKGQMVKTIGYKNQYKQFDEQLAKCGEIRDIFSDGFSKPSMEDIENRRKQYAVLMDKELFLRRIENKIGKGTAWADEDEDWE